MVTNYDHQADKWHSDEPRHQSDFCGRPEVLELIRSQGKENRILDVGCGEGYFSRKMADIARCVVGVDLSDKMIELALKKEKEQRKGIEYYVGNAKNMSFLDNSMFDICVGNYVVNYFKPYELSGFYQEIARVLKKDGFFILLLPHPLFILTTNYGEAMRYQVSEFDYIKSRGKYYEGRLATVQGDTFEVGLYHSTLEDHFSAMHSAGMCMRDVKELVFPHEITIEHPTFDKMGGKVTSVILIGEKSVRKA